MNVENQFETIADEYIELENDKILSQYEQQVNWPALKKLLPPPPARILDYGSGGGLYAELMQAEGYTVLATDNAPAIIAKIKNIPAQVWSYQDKALEEQFDVAFCKLVVQFVEDLPAFAKAMHEVLKENGCVLVSVPHPDKTRDIASSEGRHTSKIGKSGLEVQMIHRELDEYVEGFAPLFLLESTSEPLDLSAPDEPPKRLNMVFRVK